MRIRSFWLAALLACAAQAAVPVFRVSIGAGSYTLAGHDPAAGGTLTISTVLVPIRLVFKSGSGAVLDAGPDAASVLRSPVFEKFSFPGGATQYVDAMLRTTFPGAKDWHTLLGRPEVKPVSIIVPVGAGYTLTSKKTGRSLAVVDLEFVQKELFAQVGREEGKLVLAIAHDTTFYADRDATVCCSWGTHGVDASTQDSFVLASYLDRAPDIVRDQDVQPLTQQLAEFVNDPLHDPAVYVSRTPGPGNSVPPWMRPASMPAGDQGQCAGTGVATSYFLLEPTDTNPKNNVPASPPSIARSGGAVWHLQNVALLPWYTGAGSGLGSTYSFPDAHLLSTPAQPCPARDEDHRASALAAPTVAPAPATNPPNGHRLIGYWVGYGPAGSTLPAREIAPQWDVVIVAFATPDHSAPEGTMRFQTPAGLDTQQFKADIAWLKGRGKKVMISLGGGGQIFTLADPARVPDFVSSVGAIVSEYGFDGVDIDFETPSLALDPNDADFRHPTTPSVVNLISGLRQLRERFGSKFIISLVPEGPQIPGGYPSYGGQFGSYLPLAYALRDILSFVDVQDYNTPPLQGLDGEIYQAGSVDYHAAMTELLLRGFNVGGNPRYFFPPLPESKVAVGFLTGDARPQEVSQALEYIITGKAPAGTKYRLRRPGGYSGMIGAMFWTIDDDRRENYRFSNVIGPQLHAYPAAK
ncbi:MAG TPA: glycosyl hydrolase family 18 protein [Bryobacteraceae bacterium]|nr:glycosyl hydrolase family 18 protein [Bryobacteraceae bacterium]